MARVATARALVSVVTVMTGSLLLGATPDVAPPQVGISVEPDRVVEESGGLVAVTVTVGDVLASSLDVTLDTEVREGLVQYDLFRAALPAGVRIRDVDERKQRLTLTLAAGTSGDLVIDVPVFDDPEAEGDVIAAWALVPGDGFTIDPDASRDVVVISDSDADARPTVPDADLLVAGGVLDVPAPGLLAGAEDPEGAPLTLAIGSIRPSHGTVEVRPDGGFRYESAAGFLGQDAFTVRAHDGNGVSLEAWITVEVTEASPAVPAPTVSPPTGALVPRPPAPSPPPQSPAPPSSEVAAVTLGLTPDVAAESTADRVTFTLTLDRDPDPGRPVTVYVVADVAQALTQLDLFALDWQHAGLPPGEGPAPVGDFDFTGFTISLISRSVTVSAPVFDDGVVEAAQDVTFRVVPFDDVPWGTAELGQAPAIQAGAPYVVGGVSSGSVTLVDSAQSSPPGTGSGGPVPGPTATPPPTPLGGQPAQAPAGASAAAGGPGRVEAGSGSGTRPSAAGHAESTRESGRSPQGDSGSAGDDRRSTPGGSQPSEGGPSASSTADGSESTAEASENAGLPALPEADVQSAGQGAEGLDAAGADGDDRTIESLWWVLSLALVLAGVAVPAVVHLLRRRVTWLGRPPARATAVVAGVLLVMSGTAVAVANDAFRDSPSPSARATADAGARHDDRSPTEPRATSETFAASSAATTDATSQAPTSGEGVTSARSVGPATTDTARPGPGADADADARRSGGDRREGHDTGPRTRDAPAAVAGRDGPAQQAPAPVPAKPVVGISVTPTSGVEEDRTVFTVTMRSSAPPPPDGLVVDVDSVTARSLAEFDVFAASYDGLRFVRANADSSGFTVRLERSGGTVALPLFDDAGTAVEENEGTRTVTYALQPSADYDIDPAASAITITITERS